MIKRVLKNILPHGIVLKISNNKIKSDKIKVESRNDFKKITDILTYDYGFLKTKKTFSCIDANDEPIPWYTYPAIEFLNQFDFSNKCVFEFGCGYSSLYWASKAKEVFSVEDNEEWFKKMQAISPINLNISFETQSNNYANTINKSNKKIDIIVIDGKFRDECASAAVNMISNDGIIIFDNSERIHDYEEYMSAAKILNSLNFIQIDLSGFGPINDYTWTTSLYISRKVIFQPLLNINPKKPWGSI